MTNFRQLVAISAAAAAVAISQNVIAQDDLDDLLQDLAAQTDPAAEDSADVEESSPSADAEEMSDAESTIEESESEGVPEAPLEESAVDEESTDGAEPEVEEADSEGAPADSEVPADELGDPVSAEETEEEPAESEEPTEEASEEEAVAEELVDAEEPAADLEEPVSDEEPAEDPAEAEEPADVEEPTEDSQTVAEAETVAADEEPAAMPEPALPVAAAEVSDVYDGPDAELIEAIKAAERIRVQSYNLQAEREIEEARRLLGSEEYLEAARHYSNASKLMNDSPATEGLRKECQQGIAEGLYRAALQEYALGRRERALKLIEKAIERRHPKARRQKATWDAAGDPEKNEKDVTELRHVRNDDEYKSLREKNNAHLKRAQQFLSTRSLDKADEESGIVLKTDPYNQEAIRIRRQIQRKRQTIIQSEFESTREGMMADVDKAWRPVYAPDAREAVEVSKETSQTPLTMNDPERAQEQSIIKRMKEMRLPSISFKPPATIIDAVEFFRGASKDFDRPDLPYEKRGFNFYVKMPEILQSAATADSEDEGGFSDAMEEESTGSQAGVPVIPMITASDISFYDALKLVCDSVEYKFMVQNSMVTVMHKDMVIAEMKTRSYPVLSSFMDRMDTASSELKEMRSSGFGGNSRASEDEGEENQEKDWKSFFELLGVKWPEGSSIMYIKTIGKLRVRNTDENLAELEQALTEMNADPKLIEIETRFVEVCQEDLNSLGFEWILNSDYTLGLGSHLSQALGVRGGVFGKRVDASSSTSSSSSTAGTTTVGCVTAANTGTSTSTSSGSTVQRYSNSQGASWVRADRGHKGVGISSMYDSEGNLVYGPNQRYLSTLSNHISGQGYSTNDQFMKINAFLGGADLSMILHMLSQRSDTDLLSAPKVLTQSGQEAVMKVVTEYIYPTDYDVQLQSSQSGGSNNGSSRSAILAVVEPQSFQMREVGVILDVTPTLTDDGNMIDLELNTQVVDEPTWKNYGMRIPFTGNGSSLENFEGIGDILTGLADVLTTLGTGLSDAVRATFAETAVESATTALNSLTSQGDENMTYYDAPMEQPFFHVRSVTSKLSVSPGATIVMGGLITEQRKAMDDKVPFLGDIPFIGRLFRSHAEQTVKRNLLIFVTSRLVDTRGRELRDRVETTETPDVTPAPDTAQE